MVFKFWSISPNIYVWIWDFHIIACIFRFIKIYKEPEKNHGILFLENRSNKLVLNKSNKNDVIIKMTLTNPNCPVAGTMPESVGKSVEKLSNLNSIEVCLVWNPKWHKDLMSEEAKLALDIF